MKRYVCYYRVSTSKQGESGLGLEAQQQAVMQYLNGGKWHILAEFTEIESGKKSDRPKLAEAIALCKKQKATLIIAKLDRLARNVHFISGLMESGVEFIAVDTPFANRLMLHLLAAFAEHEREMISQRTKAALAVAKAKGVPLGANGRKLAERHRAQARERDQQFHPLIASLLRESPSYQAVAEKLNAMGLTTPSGARWYGSTVRNVCMRAL